MKKTILSLLLLLLLAACRDDLPPEPAGQTPAAALATEPAAATALPTDAGPRVTPTPTLLPPIPLPTPTALIDGLAVRLATPDPAERCPRRYPWFFDNPAVECADTVLNTWASMQRFEHGLMVWFQEGGRTVVLIDDGSPFKPYREVADTGAPTLPDPDPAPVVPPGLFLPDHGFAKFWRGIVPGAEWVREALGWATGLEQGYSALWQCNLSEGTAARCYFTGPQDEIIVMTRGPVAYWTYWQGPVR